MPNMASPALPRVKYIIRHHSDNKPPHNQCVHFITFGLNHGPLKLHPPPILHLDLSNHDPPPPNLCETSTGLDDDLSKSFFSFPANDDEFHRARDTLWRRMKRESRGKCVVVLINCMAGMHRSVAMAERLAEKLGMREGFRAECLHLDLAKGAVVRDEIRWSDVRDSSECLRREVRTWSDARGGLRDAADKGEPSRRESKTVSFRTSTRVRDPRPRQRETLGGSAGPSRKDDTRRSRLSP